MYRWTDGSLNLAADPAQSSAPQSPDITTMSSADTTSVSWCSKGTVVTVGSGEYQKQLLTAADGMRFIWSLLNTTLSVIGRERQHPMSGKDYHAFLYCQC